MACSKKVSNDYLCHTLTDNGGNVTTYAIVFEVLNKKWISFGPSFQSKDGEYRAVHIEHDIVAKWSRDYEELYAQIEEHLLSKSDEYRMNTSDLMTFVSAALIYFYFGRSGASHINAGLIGTLLSDIKINPQYDVWEKAYRENAKYGLKLIPMYRSESKEDAKHAVWRELRVLLALSGQPYFPTVDCYTIVNDASADMFNNEEQRDKYRINDVIHAFNAIACGLAQTSDEKDDTLRRVLQSKYAKFTSEFKETVDCSSVLSGQVLCITTQYAGDTIATFIANNPAADGTAIMREFMQACIAMNDAGIINMDLHLNNCTWHDSKLNIIDFSRCILNIEACTNMELNRDHEYASLVKARILGMYKMHIPEFYESNREFLKGLHNTFYEMNFGLFGLFDILVFGLRLSKLLSIPGLSDLLSDVRAILTNTDLIELPVEATCCGDTHMRALFKRYFGT